MKPQDIAFAIALVALLLIKKQQWFVAAGLACIAVSTALFSRWIFFTAERLTWYAAAFFLSAVLTAEFSKRRGA